MQCKVLYKAQTTDYQNNKNVNESKIAIQKQLR